MKTEFKGQTMSAQLTELVTKREALGKVIQMLDAKGVIDLEPFLELLTWQNKLVLWLLKDKEPIPVIKQY